MKQLLSVVIVLFFHFSYANSCWVYFFPPQYKYKYEDRSSVVEQINEDRYELATQPEFRGLIRAEELLEFDTLRLFSISGRIQPNSQVRMLLTHGNGARYSHADAMRRALRYFSDNTQTAKASSLVTRIRQYSNFVRASAEAPDLPFHRFGPRTSEFQDPEYVTDYWIRYLKIMKAETPHLPLVVFTRSSSSILFLRVAEKAPELIDGLILMSPTIPLSREIILDASRVLYKKAALGEFPIHPEGLDWIDSILLQSKWTHQTSHKIPTLIFTGSNDWEVVATERDFLKDISSHNPQIRYYDIQGAGHDVLMETKTYKERDILKTLMIMQDFLKSLTKP